MPIYAYKCSSCGISKDILRKISDPTLTLCPECGQEALEKQVTAAGFQLKGSGWYVTDFREGGKATAVPPVSGDRKGEGNSGAQSKADTASKDASSNPAPATPAAATPSATVTSAPSSSTPPPSGSTP
jgi:putative FmdB family regulatory protein